MTGKWKTILNKKLKLGAVFMDLSKVFNTLDHYMLLVQLLNEYSFDNNSSSFVQSYLRNRYPRCKIRMILVAGTKITTDIPQVSVLGPFSLIFYQWHFPTR